MPLYSNSISAGFPSPAEDFIDKKLDLHELLIKNPLITFFVKVSGKSITNAVINHDVILIID